jgi:hypothetical protein
MTAAALTSRAQLVSLLDMLVNYAAFFATSSRSFSGFYSRFQHDPKSDSVASEEEIENLTFALDFAAKTAAALGMTGTEHLADELCRTIKVIRRKHAIAAKLSSVQSILAKELSERRFLYVPPERASFYNNKNLCGKIVAEKFPAAEREIVEAGNCYALERPTACVFHLMRVVPYGIWALSKLLKVKYSNNFILLDWNSLIQPIENAVNAMAKLSRTIKKRDDQRYYSEIVQHLYFCKDAWRNHVSHSNEAYDMAQAESVMDHTSLVMKLVAARVKQPVTKLR